MNKEKGLKLHHFLSHILPVIQLIIYGLILICALIVAFMADSATDVVNGITTIILCIPTLVLVILILSVKNEMSEKCYKRVRLYYWVTFILNSLNIILGLATDNTSTMITNIIWAVVSVLILIYYKNRKDMFVNPWNDSEKLYCRKCGSELINGSTYCQKCGEKVV